MFLFVYNKTKKIEKYIYLYRRCGERRAARPAKIGARQKSAKIPPYRRPWKSELPELQLVQLSPSDYPCQCQSLTAPPATDAESPTGPHMSDGLCAGPARLSQRRRAARCGRPNHCTPPPECQDVTLSKMIRNAFAGGPCGASNGGGKKSKKNTQKSTTGGLAAGRASKMADDRGGKKKCLSTPVLSNKNRSCGMRGCGVRVYGVRGKFRACVNAGVRALPRSFFFRRGPCLFLDFSRGLPQNAASLSLFFFEKRFKKSIFFSEKIFEKIGSFFQVLNSDQWLPLLTL